MITKYFKVTCDECGWDLAKFSYEPTEIDLKEENIICWGPTPKTFCCSECKENYLQRIGIGYENLDISNGL